MRSAATELYNVLSSDEYLSQKIDKIEAIAKEDGAETIARNTIATLAKAVISIVNPALYASIGAVDIFLGVTDEVKSVYTMYAMAEMENAIFSAVASVREDFRSTQTIENAAAYKAGLEMCFVFAYQTCYYVDEHLENVFKKGLIKEWVRNQESYDIYKGVVSDAREHILWSYESVINSPKELYEICISKLDEDYIVTYNVNGGLNEPEAHVKGFSDDVTLSDIKPERSGYTFKGWAYGDPVDYIYVGYPGATVNFGDGDYNFYAIWEQNTYGIAFHANGGSGGPTSVLKYGGEDLTLPTEEPTREGYYFAGWALSPSVEEPDFYAGGTLNIDSALNLYAVWTPGTFNILFDANGGSYSDNSTVITKEKTYLKEFTIDLEQPTRRGYKFSGWWSLSADGSRDYEHGKTYNDIGGAGLGAKTLYAVWEDTLATMIYDHSDWVEDPNDPNESYVEHVTTTEIDITNGTAYVLENPEIDSYNGNSFKGWKYYDNGGTLLDLNGNAHTLLQPGETIELDPTDGMNNYVYAKWTYYVHYNHGTESTHLGVNDGTLHTVESPIANGDKTFDGWLVAETGETVQPGDTITLTADMTMNAIWDGETTEEPEETDPTQTYTITYDYNNGSGTTVTQDKTAGVDVTLSVYDPTYEGYTFLGWALGDDLDTVIYQTGDTYSEDADLDLYAVWEAVETERNIIAEGTCGDALTWVLDDAGLLTIEGTGAMDDYEFDIVPAPWSIYRSNILSIEFPYGITNIGAFAFWNYDKITQVDIPDTVTEIGARAFDGCDWLEEVYLGRGVTTLGQRSFSYCPKLTFMSISDQLTAWFEDELYWEGEYYGSFSCSPVNTIHVPATVRSIPEILVNRSTTSAFIYEDFEDNNIIAAGICGNNLHWSLDNEGLMMIEGTGTMYNYDFSASAPWRPYRQKIFSIKFSDGITSIGEFSFWEHDKISQIVIPDTVTEIGARAFDGCDWLEEVYLGRSVTTLDQRSFSYCPKLTFMSISDQLTAWFEDELYWEGEYYGSFSCSPVNTIHVPATVRSIPEILVNRSTTSAFVCEDSEYVNENGYLDDAGILYKYNTYTKVKTLVKCPTAMVIETYTVLDGTTAIGASSFSGKTALTSVQIPASVTSVGNSAFSGCSILEAAYFFGDAPTTVGTSMFASTASDFTIYYIEGTSGWTNPWNGYATATFNPADIDVAVKGISLSHSTAELLAGSSLKLTVTLTPENATNTNVSWTSSDSSVASVTNGVVTGVSSGSAVITATTEDGGYTASCTVTVLSESDISEETLLVELGDAYTSPGNTVTVPVVITQNPGLVSMTLKVEYDETVLTLTEVVDTGLLPGATHTTKYASPYTLTWENDTALSDYTVEGTIANLVFTVVEDAELGSTVLNVTSPKDGIYNFDAENIDYYIVSGIVTISDVTFGDANGDGEVTNKDRLLISRYLADWEGYDVSMINLNAADVNCDGELTNKDRMILSRHLASWEGYETLPIQ